MKSNLVIFLLMMSSLSAFSQQDSIAPRKLFYFNSVLSGALLGKKGNGTSLSVSMTHGIRIKDVSLGVGIGYDSYLEWRTMPVFADLSFDFAKIKRNAFYIQCSAGYSKSWRPESEADVYDYSDKGGRGIHPMIGYRISTGEWSIYFAGGYKFQRIEYEMIPPPWWGWMENKTTVKRDVDRLSIHIGIGLH